MGDGAFEKPHGENHQIFDGKKPVLMLWDPVPENIPSHTLAIRDFITSHPTAATLLITGVSEKSVPGTEHHVSTVLTNALVDLIAKKPVRKTPETPTQRYDHFLVMDFEASGHCRDSMKWEIVEFPCIALNTATLHPTAEFHEYVRPTTIPELSEFCKENCGIVQEQVDKADTIDVVVIKFLKWVESLNLGKVLVVTCGNYDMRTALRAECLNKGIEGLPAYLRRWCNIKEIFAEKFLPPHSRQLGMAGMLSHQRLPLVGRHHSGLDDTRNIASLTAHIIAKAGAQLYATGAYEPARPDTPPVSTQPMPTRPTLSPKPVMKKKTRVQ
eukprot:TRINITY_DN26287_c0_g1_i1.p1 TRINITY_DN26287_c0_g1~~TRINITY_DN26287_c0_g1_i1.p1  ORF type:complete len:361 (+),score=52.58 TRINITY_DN26287_c0_g1_i1:105-1085(+)